MAGGQSREGEAEAVPGRDAEDVRGIPADEEILAFGVAVKFHVVDLRTAVDTRLAVRTGHSTVRVEEVASTFDTTIPACTGAMSVFCDTTAE